MARWRQALLVWVLFLIPLPGLTRLFRSFLTIAPADIRARDCLLIQAFGRRHYADAGLRADLERIALPRQTDPAAALAALAEAGFDPGSSNRALAQLTVSRYLTHNSALVVIAQWEVVFALWQASPARFERLLQQRQLVCLWPEDDYYATWHVKSASVTVMRQLGLNRPIELTHHGMTARAIMILWRLGVAPVWELPDIPYDAQSIQWWTRGPWLWVFRETPGRVVHVWFPRRPERRWVAWLPPR